MNVKNIEKESLSIEQIEKQVKSIGIITNALGWFTIILNLLVFLLQILNIDVLDLKTDFTGLFLSLLVGFLFVVLGNRIKSVYDEKIKTYITILLVIIIIFSAVVWSAGGFIGLFGLIYMIYAYIKYNKLLKNEEYKGSLVGKEYKIKKVGWIVIAVLSLILAFLAYTLDANYMSSDISDSDIQKVVDSLKSSYDFPLQFNEQVVWTDVTAEGNAMRYHYEISNLGDIEISEELTKEHMIDVICGDSSTKNLLDNGIDLEYLYTIKETREEILLSFTSEDCK